MRLFTAIDLPAPVRTSYADVQSDLQDVISEEDLDLEVRWSDPEQFHITIRFIGEVEPSAFARYRDALADVDAEPFAVEPYGLDVLPARQAPRVLTIGLPLSDPLRHLYAEVSRVLENVGLDPESRDYRPHVTLGRFQNADARVVHRLLRSVTLSPFAPWPVRRFHLYESTLRPEGAVHAVRASYDV